MTTSFDVKQHLEEVNPIYAAGAAVLAAVIFAIARFASPRRTNAMTLSVRWGREKLRVPLPSPDTKLGALRSILAEQTSLPPSSFKLVHAGAVMKDDNAPLSSYGLRDNSKIAIIDGGANAARSAAGDESKNKTKPETEEATIAVIRDELANVQQRVVPALDAFLAIIAPPPQPSPTFSAPDAAPGDNPSSRTPSQTAPTTQPSIPKPPPSSSLPDIETEHRRLGEELLQSLLRLDVLNLDGSWASARSERKSAVKAVQALLDRLDGGWRERKERLASQDQQQQQEVQ